MAEESNADIVSAVSANFKRDLEQIMAADKRRKPAAQIVMRDGTIYELTMEQARRAIAAALTSPNVPAEDPLSRLARNANRPIRLRDR